MKRNFVYISDSVNAHENMAVDEWFLEHVGKDDLILYFYQNENAVIIGKNQNPWVECDLDAMSRDNVTLARRVSGGGAVYHDLGNLNFSFICGEERYDREGQLSLILEAVKRFGIPCEFSGRNDLLSEGKKFSGNAFADRKGKKLHHGTLLVSSDLERLSRYLTVDPKKIRSKGIASVRSRVCNLTEQKPDLTVKDLQKAILSVFVDQGGYYGEFAFSAREREEVRALCQRHSDRDWFLGQTPKFDLEWKERFPWGSVQICFSFEKGRIAGAKVYSDAMDPSFCEEVERCLAGIPFEKNTVRQALRSSSIPEVAELSKFSMIP